MRDDTTKAPKKLVPAIMALLVVLIGATGLVLSTQLNDKTESDKVATSQTEQTAKPQTQAANIVSYSGVEGQTALALLKTKAEVVTKDSSYGPYVDTINGVAGGTEGKYWAFYVNGEMAQVGADAYVTKAGDKIEWKFE